MRGWMIGLALCLRASACEIDFVYSTEPAAPYQIGQGVAIPPKPGIAVETVREVAAAIGCMAHISRLPNVRVLAETQAGRHDGAFMFSYNKERQDGGLVYPMREGKPDHERRIASQTYYLYRIKGSAVDWDGSHILHLEGVVGVNTGWSIGKDLRALGVPVEEVPGAVQNFDKLHAGRIGAYATEDGPAAVAMRPGVDDDIERLPIPLARKDNFVVFSERFYNQHHELAERFWRELAARRDELHTRLALQYQASSGGR